MGRFWWKLWDKWWNISRIHQLHHQWRYKWWNIWLLKNLRKPWTIGTIGTLGTMGPFSLRISHGMRELDHPLTKVVFGEVTWYPVVFVVIILAHIQIVILHWSLTLPYSSMFFVPTVAGLHMKKIGWTFQFWLECRQHWKQLRPQPCQCVAMDSFYLLETGVAMEAEETPKLKESLAKISDMRPGAEVGRRGCLGANRCGVHCMGVGSKLILDSRLWNWIHLEVLTRKQCPPFHWSCSIRFIR